MKNINKSKALLASSILTALVGCSSEDYTPETKVNSSAPVHGGDINLAFHEKDAFRAVNLLGNFNGGDNSQDLDKDGSVKDADHNGDGEIANADRDGDGIAQNIDYNNDGIVADIDANGDGTIANTDIDGDGEIVSVDRNGDGEVANIDLNGDGMFANVDLDGDGEIANTDHDQNGIMVNVDINGDGVIANIDLNGDGESTNFDANGDGTIANVDVNGDGVIADVDTNGDGVIANVDTDDDGVFDVLETEVEHEIEIENELEVEHEHEIEPELEIEVENARDADGDTLNVVDVVITREGDRIDDIGDLGVQVLGNKIGVRPLDIAPYLDTDEVHNVTVSYNITDGESKVPRTFTFSVEGEDFAPEVVGDLVGNYVRDAGVETLDLLRLVTDADGEELTVSNLTADADNVMEMPFTVNGTEVEVDVAAVKAVIPDGQKVSFNFTYTISDHRFDIERNMVINVLGVKDVPGAPLVGNYFKGDSILETDGLQVYDLTDEVVEREGEEIVISNLMLNGSETIPYGIELDGTVLKFNPNAFYDDIAAGAIETYTITYKVSDINGNMSDGDPQVQFEVTGVESNLFAANGVDVGFENGGTGIANTWCDPGSEITNTTVANGSNAFQMLGAPCYASIAPEYFPDMVKGAKYYLRYNAYVGAGHASPYIMIHNNSGDANHNFWVGARPWHPANDSWRPLLISYDTTQGYLAAAGNDGLTPMDTPEALQMYLMSAWLGNDGMPVFDDFKFVRYDDLEGVDALTGNPGSFEDADYVPMSTGGGTVEVRQDPNDAANNVLYVDTTGADAAGVKVTFPVPNGAIVSGGQYRVTYKTQYLNYQANKDAGTDPNINQWGGYRFEVVFANADTGLDFTLFSDVWNGAAFGEVQGIADETSHWWGHGTVTDWNTDNATVSFVLKGVNAQYIIDDIKVERIP